MTREDHVAEFNIVGGNKNVYEEGLLAPHINCFSEELSEFNVALADYVTDPTNDHRRAMIKEWADVQASLSNLAWYFNFNGEEAFQRVAQSNMSKLVDGKLEKNEDGKVLKGPNYEAPDMGGL